MSEAGQKSVLARKADLVRNRAPRKSMQMDFGTKPQKGFHRAIKRAGVPFKTLDPEPRNENVTWDQTLPEVTENLPENGLLVVLEGEERVRGILHLEQGFLDALIEVQTTGHVDTVEGAGRPATKIDAALSRDYIDLLLSALDSEFEDMGIANIVMRMHFGTVIPDRKQLPLLVPERGFHVFQATVSLAQDAKIGGVIVALPGTQTAAASWPKRGPDPLWRQGFHQTIGQARLELSTVLFRRRISLKAAMALEPGTVIPFDADALQAVRVEDSLGRAVLKGRLGQSSGNRALRLTTGAVIGSEAPPEEEAPRFGESRLDAGAGGMGPDIGAASEPLAGLDLGADVGADLNDELGGDMGLPPLDGDLPPLGEDGGLPPLDSDGGLPPLGGDGLPPLDEDGGLPPLGGDGLPPLDGDGGLPPLGDLPETA